jgi:hypothetical protein
MKLKLSLFLVGACTIFSAKALDEHSDISNQDIYDHGADLVNEYQAGYVAGFDVAYPSAPIDPPAAQDSYADPCEAFFAGWSDGYTVAADGDYPFIQIGPTFYPHVGVFVSETGFITGYAPDYTLVDGHVFYAGVPWVAAVKVFPAPVVTIINSRHAAEAVRILPQPLVSPAVRAKYGSAHFQMKPAFGSTAPKQLSEAPPTHSVGHQPSAVPHLAPNTVPKLTAFAGNHANSETRASVHHTAANNLLSTARHNITHTSMPRSAGVAYSRSVGSNGVHAGAAKQKTSVYHSPVQHPTVTTQRAPAPRPVVHPAPKRRYPGTH